MDENSWISLCSWNTENFRIFIIWKRKKTTCNFFPILLNVNQIGNTYRIENLWRNFRSHCLKFCKNSASFIIQKILNILHVFWAVLQNCGLLIITMQICWCLGELMTTSLHHFFVKYGMCSAKNSNQSQAYLEQFTFT